MAPYARCLEPGCGLEFADRDAASEHSRATLGPPIKRDNTVVVAAGHAYRVENPTPEELQRSRVWMAISRLLDDLYERLDHDVQSGKFTAEELKAELVHYDLAEGWDQYLEEGEG